MLRRTTRRTLAAGKGLVTANKAMIAHHGMELAEAAEATGAIGEGGSSRVARTGTKISRPWPSARSSLVRNVCRPLVSSVASGSWAKETRSASTGSGPAGSVVAPRALPRRTWVSPTASWAASAPSSSQRGSRGHGRDHVVPAFVPPHTSVPVLEGRLMLGVWQRICLVDTNTDNHQRHVRFSFLAG